ncbi:ABC transporter permease [Flaviflexus salsibiostraticola]|uniref:ABC transporter permease n=1 Tax=Flaviflexus salsibiostraticola TaxID=1282737 RepID=A0A3Q8WUY9_9ACTO|nr:methionine ABC transporter permease [Flaviflexus salsibiostraticola]AZN30933.1 ABC transporter permease [Flaviflexus salsibiostraticola]
MRTEMLWFDQPVIQNSLWSATVETLLMVGWSTLATVLLGLPLGILLVTSAKTGIRPAPVLNQILSAVVNIGRSIPFIILLIILLPVTDWVMQTNIGWRGMVFPLAVGSIPFFARLVETNLLAVDTGKIEAAQMMGATRTRIMGDVILREAMPGIIQSITVLVITIIGFSAMGGTVGGGGLGALAYNYGYQRYFLDVLIITIVVIIVIVQIVQTLGDMLSRYVDHR